jgi:Bacterial Ig domain
MHRCQRGSISIVVAPTHGTAAVANGAVTYTPATGYSGLDTFQYSVQDNLGTTSNVATVSIDLTAPPSGGGGGGGGGALGFLELATLVSFVAMTRRRDRH